MLWKGIASLALAALIPVSHAQDCPAYNTQFANTQNPTDSTQHNAGYFHQGLMIVNGQCAYTDQQNTSNCAIACTTSVTGMAADEGGVVFGYQHAANYNSLWGQAGSNGPSVSCGDQVGIAVRSCPVLWLTCDIAVSISGSANGLSANVSYSSPPLWNPTLAYSYACASHQQSSPPPVCNPTGSPNQVPEQGNTWVWDYSSCMWVQVPYQPSPIVIDTNGEGFHLTSAADGVVFDFFGDGHPIQIAWTAKSSQNGWLALPNKDGTIASARDLFGNLTAQYLTPSHPPNGFAALSVYDAPAQGGNGNGMIDPGDAIWGKLRVWIDSNHDGIALPAELHTLDSLGIGHIDLRYMPSRDVDKYGNQFRYEGDLAAASANDDIDRKIFDVFLTTK